MARRVKIPRGRVQVCTSGRQLIPAVVCKRDIKFRMHRTLLRMHIAIESQGMAAEDNKKSVIETALQH
jgi:hypothetical protein